MASSELREAYYQLLMEQIRSCQYPSPGMLDRIEQSVDDRETAEEYVQVLIDRLGEGRFPSPVMLDRVAGLVDRLDRAR